jgi:hypothetical protein
VEYVPGYYGGIRYVEDDILKMDLKSLGTQYIAILIDPPLFLPEESPSSLNKGKITLVQFVSFISLISMKKGGGTLLCDF